MKISKLKKEIGEFSLEIENIEITNNKINGFIGSNGSGKSTLAKCIMNIYEYNGEIINDFDYTQKSYMSQKPYILNRSVYENIIYPLKIRKLEINEEEINEKLKLIDLYNLRHTNALSLSSGQKQKLSFIRGIIYNPELIIIDETFSNLDVEISSKFIEIIKEIQLNNPKTWIFISHQMAQVKNICDNVCFFNKGKIEKYGKTEDIFNNRDDDNLNRFLKQWIIKE